MARLTRLIFVGLLLFGVVASSRAQTDDCDVTLDKAFDEFTSGHFYAIPSVLDPCLKQFSREQSQRAYLLLTQTYLLLDDPIGAKQSYMSLLRANPEFETDTAAHSIDVIYLSKRFTATSIVSWFAKAGTNIANPRTIHDLSAFGETGIKERYRLKLGYQLSFGGDINFTEEINLRGEMQYTLSTLRTVTESYWEQDYKQVTERQNWLSLPLTVTYNDTRGKYRPYGYLGYGYHWLANANATVFLRNNRPEQSPSGEEGDRENTSEESPSFNVTYKRNRFNQSVIVGGGVKMKFGLDFLFVDLRYNFGLKNITRKDGLYGDYRDEQPTDATSESLVTSFDSSMGFADVGDFLRLDNLSVSIGFLRPLYKPRELKRARTRSVMKKMNR